MHDTVTFLKTVSGFGQIDPDDIEAIADQCEEISFKPEEKLMSLGEPGDTMYVIRDGRVRIPLPDKDSGEIRNQAYLGPSDIVGEMALLTGEPRIADVIAETDVSTVAIRRDTLLPLLRAHPQLARILTEILGSRLESGGGIDKVGKYRLLGKLGEGATSKVYQALHPTLNRVVAVKMLSHTLVYDDNFKERFLDEARTIAGLSHPNLVHIYDTEAAYMTYFIVMEKVSGTDLARVLVNHKKLSADHVLNILSQLGGVLEYAHNQGIVHRDVKPANCMLTESGTVKLMDFGIAQRIEQDPLPGRLDIVEGTPRYLAPEAAIGRQVDGRADIYALGVMAFEMLTGQVPFCNDNIHDLLMMHVRQEPPDITKLVPQLPPGLVEFVRGTMIKDPDKRLTDWPTIRSLLAPTPESDRLSSPPNLTSNKLVSISFSPSRRYQVDAAVETLVSYLDTLDDVQVATAKMVPVTRAAALSSDRSAAPTDAPLPAATSPLCELLD